jgi:hypothetical protein
MTTVPPANLSPLELTDQVQVPAAQHPVWRFLLRLAVYLSAACLGLLAAPMLFIFASRDAALHWANVILDFVAR